MKIGNKFWYTPKHIEPKEEDYQTIEDWAIASAVYKLSTSEIGFLLSAEAVAPSAKVKTWRKRYKNKELKIGNKVNVCRWDWNGIDEVVDITEIHELENSVKVICKQGWFIFDGFNEPEFKWNKQKDKWYKEYMTRVRTEDYFYIS